MNTDETLESNSNEGSTGSPNSAISSNKNVSSTSTLLPEQLESLVSKMVEKRLQSQHDKRVSGIEKTLDSFKPVLEQVKALLTPEQMSEFNRIQRDAEFEDMKRRVYGDASTGTPATGNQPSTANSISDVLKQFPELDPNDTEVVQNVLTQTDPEKAELAASRLLRKRANPTQPSPSAAGTIVTPPIPPSDLMEQFNKEAKNVHGMALIDLKMSYRKKGLDVN